MMLKTLAFAGSAYAAMPTAEKVTNLPEVGDLSRYNFEVYSGYADVTDTKKLHYVLITSQNSMKDDPLQIWFNGGPGCSSMMGIFQEHGPWVVNDGQRYLVENEWSWNKNANMLYIEMPGGVGFSTCDAEAGECVFTDETTAEDNIVALVNWFAKYPDFKDHDLFVSGESYGGVYVPYASKHMLDYNAAHTEPTDFNFNLKGFIVGNGVTNWDVDCDKAFITMGFWHGLYDKKLKDAMATDKCDYGNLEFLPEMSAACEAHYQEFLDLTADINTYDVFRKCYRNDGNPADFLYAEDHFGMAKVGNEVKTYRKYYTQADYTPFLYHSDVQEARKMVTEIPPCVYGSYVVDYLNSYAVRDALFIPDTVQAWGYCTDNPLWNYASGKNASYSIYEEMVTKHPEIKIMVYSGDTDGSVPTEGTLAWLDLLKTDHNLQVTKKWAPYYWDGQVAGYTFETAHQLTFGSIQGCGHMAPQWKRPQTWHLIYDWMAGLKQ